MKREYYLYLVIAFFVFQSCKNDKKGPNESKESDVSIVPAVTEIQQEEINDSIKLLFGGNYYFGIVEENSEDEETSLVKMRKINNSGTFGSFLFHRGNYNIGDSVVFNIAEKAGIVYATNLKIIHLNDSIYKSLIPRAELLKNKFGAMYFDTHRPGAHKAFHGISKIIVGSTYNTVTLRMTSNIDSIYLMTKSDCIKFMNPDLKPTIKYFHVKEIAGNSLKLVTEIKDNQPNHIDDELWIH